MSRWIDIDDDRNCYIGNDGEYERWNIDPDVLNEAKPTIESERKKGKWVRQVLGSTAGYGTTVMYQCSNCEQMAMSRYHYCPNCGAEMRGEGG